MDGNGRWAEHRGMARTEGHEQGEHALFDVIGGALELGIEWLTVYAFSTENWNRPEDEVRFLLNFNRTILRRRCEELNEMGVRIRFVGRRDWRVPKGLITEMDEAIELTQHNKAMTLAVAFNYGGRAEIVDAVKRIAAQRIPSRLINERTIARHLYDQEMPEPETASWCSALGATARCGRWPRGSARPAAGSGAAWSPPAMCSSSSTGGEASWMW